MKANIMKTQNYIKYFMIQKVRSLKVTQGLKSKLSKHDAIMKP